MRINGIQPIYAQMQPAAGLRDIKPPVDIPENHLWIILLSAAGAALVCVLVWRFIEKTRHTRVRPTQEPWQIALDALGRLKREEFSGEGKEELFYVRLSDVIRGYFEQRFSIHAPEMTSEEFLRYIHEKKFLNEELQSQLKDFLRASDMVKFARYQPDAAQAARDLNTVKRIIEGNK